MLINEAYFRYFRPVSRIPTWFTSPIFLPNGPDPQYRSYTAAKAGLDNLALSYAQLWAPKFGLTDQPGPILFLPTHSEEHKQKVLANTLLRREEALPRCSTRFGCCVTTRT